MRLLLRLADHGGSASAAPAASDRPLDPRFLNARSPMADSMSASETPAATPAPAAGPGHLVMPSWRSNEADFVVLGIAPTLAEGWEDRSRTFLTNYLPGPMSEGIWRPSLPKPKAKATAEVAPAKAASKPRPKRPPDQWQSDWQDSSWWQGADDYDRYPSWSGSQR